MSQRAGKIMSLAGGVDFTEKPKEQLKDMFLKVLNNGMHGLCFSPYLEGQKPGDILTEAQIRKRMEIIKPYTKWVRSFSCIEGNELIPKIAKEYGLKTLVGAWLGKDTDKNEEELSALIHLAKHGLVDIAAVGNEVLYRDACCHFTARGYDYIVDEVVDFIKKENTSGKYRTAAGNVQQ